MRRGPWWILVAPAVALAAAAGRWALQGSGNVYTAPHKRFYVKDPDLGWRVVDGGPFWIGLELLGVLAGVLAGAAAVAWLLRRFEKKRGAPIRWARLVVGAGAALTLLVPIYAFATGLGPDGGRESLPEGATAAAPTEGIEGSLDAPPGRYTVVPHKGSAITAKLSAGKETFEARFARGIEGWLELDLRDFTKPIAAELSVDAKGVDSGVDLRDEHARDKYLATAEYPRMGLRLGKLVAARQDGPAQLAFRAEASLDFLGEALPVEVTGNLRVADDAARTRLGLPAGVPALLVAADLAITVKGSGLRTSAGSFDADRIPITVSLVLVKQP